MLLFVQYVMGESAYFVELAKQSPDRVQTLRHSLVVRLTHWVNAGAFLGLLISGGMIIVAHPRLYWGETGGWGTRSLINLPIPFILGYSGWGRYLHFLSAWVCVLSGVVYVSTSFIGGHFRKNLMPTKSDVAWGAISRDIANHMRLRRAPLEDSLQYNVLQRLTYLGVVFVLFPLIILTGFAMSPSITSVAPAVVNIFGGQQSARTLHFFIACFLVLFLLVHLVMTWLAGFAARTRAMITGRSAHE